MFEIGCVSNPLGQWEKSYCISSVSLTIMQKLNQECYLCQSERIHNKSIISPWDKFCQLAQRITNIYQSFFSLSVFPGQLPQVLSSHQECFLNIYINLLIKKELQQLQKLQF